MSDSEEEKNEVAEMDSFEEEEKAREESNRIFQCFTQFDPESEGVIRTSDLKAALEHLGESCSDK